MFNKKDLVKAQRQPYEQQYLKMLSNVEKGIVLSDDEITLGFSGGKDSALVLDMYADIKIQLGLKDKPLNVFFANTTNETRAMINYIHSYVKRIEEKYNVKINFQEKRPQKTFVDVVKEEGLPFISKATSKMLRTITRDLEENNISFEDVKKLHNPTMQARDALREMGLSDTTVLGFTGWSCNRNDFGIHFVLAKQWLPLLDIKKQTGYNICFSEKCCDILKKASAKSLDNLSVMTGERADESRTRESAWLAHGCNYINSTGDVKSKPLSTASNDAVLYAIKYRNIPLCSDYGEIEEYRDAEGKIKYRCTKAQRTGCSLCGFGIKKDTERFIRLQKEEPAKVAFAFKPISQGGLGYKEVCEYCNEYCGTKIKIPTI